MSSKAGLLNYALVNPPKFSSSGTENVQDREGLLILDRRALDRECLASALADHELGMAVVATDSIEEWRQKKGAAPPLVAVLFNTDQGML
jgi:hypothetical protein